MKKTISTFIISLFIVSAIVSQENNQDFNAGFKTIQNQQNPDNVNTCNTLISQIQTIRSENQHSRALVFLQDSSYAYSWGDYTEVWDPNMRTYFSYNDYGQKILTIDHLFDTIQNQWNNRRRYEWSYQQGGGNKTESLRKLWSPGTSQWVNSYKWEYLYNDENQQTGENRFNWDGDSEDWINDQKDIYLLNEEGLPSEIILQRWNTDSAKYLNVSRRVLTYDSANRITNEVFYIWSDENQTWAKDVHRVTNYEENKTITYTQTWSPGTNSWVNSRELSLTYDGDENKWTERLERVWFDNAWRNYRQTNYFWDENEYFTGLILLSWDILGEEWENLVRISTTNDEYGNWLEDIFEYWDMQYNEWYFVDKYNYYWSLHESLWQEELRLTEISCYPNPVRLLATIEFTLENAEHVQVRILNSRGQLVETLLNQYQSAGHHKINWDASGFSSGMYFYSIGTSAGNSTGKIQLIK